MLRDRSGHILEAVIREFIRTGDPVSSGFLYDQYDFGIRPARIRAELVELTDEGYLEQPHHSAGRTPSDKGYGFYADQMLQGAPRAGEVSDLAHLFFDARWDAFLGGLAEQLGVVSLVGSGAEEVRARGFEYLARNLLAESRECLAEALHEIERIEEQFDDLNRIFPEEDFVRVFIGKQNPLVRNEELSMFAGDYEVEGERCFLVAVGPKRMNYEKAARIFKGLKRNNK